MCSCLLPVFGHVLLFTSCFFVMFSCLLPVFWPCALVYFLFLAMCSCLLPVFFVMFSCLLPVFWPCALVYFLFFGHVLMFTSCFFGHVLLFTSCFLAMCLCLLLNVYLLHRSYRLVFVCRHRQTVFVPFPLGTWMPLSQTFQLHSGVFVFDN